MDVCKYKKILNMFHVSIMNHYVLDETEILFTLAPSCFIYNEDYDI